MSMEDLHTYLSDHLAGSVAALELVDHLIKTYEEEPLERIREFGLHESVTVGDAPEKFVEAVEKWTSVRGVDVILDLVGGPYFSANLQALVSRLRFFC